MLVIMTGCGLEIYREVNKGDTSNHVCDHPYQSEKRKQNCTMIFYGSYNIKDNH